jgi:hypothetical protein
VRPTTDDLVARLAAADPARELGVDGTAREELWQRILAEESTRAAVPARPRRRRARIRPFVLVVPLLLAVTAGALAAGGVIQFGAPTGQPPGYSRSSRSGLGGLTQGTVRLLAISTQDPVGGPAWGMRVFSTTRGVGCIQVGRLVDGRLGALGQDGAFHDDGLFHELGTSTFAPFYNCTTLDANGRIFTNVAVGDEPASGWGLVGRYAHGGCVPATSSPAERAGAPAICPQGDERDLYYGLLGPDASSITYVLAGQSHTVPTVGPEGAYLIVTKAAPEQLFDFADGGTNDVVPVDGPITALHYRNGATCHLTSRSWIGGVDACTPTLKVPVGYVPPKRTAYTSAQVAAPLRVRLLHAPRGGYEIAVSFTSRVAIAHARSKYLVEWHQPNMPPQVNAYHFTDSDIAADQTVNASIGGLGPPLTAGVTRGTVTFKETNLPSEEEEPGLLVGHFAVRVP